MTDYPTINENTTQSKGKERKVFYISQ